MCDDQEGPRSMKEEEQEDKHYPEPALGFLKCTPLKKTVTSFLYICTTLACIMDKIFLTWKKSSVMCNVRF